MKKILLFAIMFICISSIHGSGIYIEPYLQNPGKNTMTILWWTNEKCAKNFVEYSSGKNILKAKASNEYVPSMKKYLHEANLSNLTLDTLYKYKVYSDEGVSSQYTFRTAVAADKDFSFAIIGDGRTDNNKVIKRHRRIVKQAGKCDIIFGIGDMVHEGSTRHWLRFLRQVITASDSANPGSTVASTTPLLMAVGNHEIYIRNKEEYAPGKFEGGGYSGGGLHTSMTRFKACVANPPNNSKNSDWEERYYAVNYGSASFIVLDNNNADVDEYDNHNLLNDKDAPSWAPGSEQYRWLIRQLKKARRDSVFTFVLFHPSPYSRGFHGVPHAKSDTQRGYELRVLDPIFRKYGVDAVFSSHDHIVEHCLTGPKGFYRKMDVADPKNLNYIVMGNSGHSSRHAKKGWEKWMTIPGSAKALYTKWFYTWSGNNSLASFLEVKIKNNNDGTFTAIFEIVRSDGKRFNKFSIKRK